MDLKLLSILLCTICCYHPKLIDGQLMPDISSLIVKSVNNTKDLTCFLPYVNGLQSVPMEMWALTMFDATSKLQSGLLSGNLYNYGDFDQCIDILASNESPVSGKYCMAGVKTDLQLPMTEKIAKQRNGMQTIQNLNRMFNGQPKDAPGIEGIDFTWSACVPDDCSAQDVDIFFNNLLIAFNLSFVQLQFNDELCQTKATITSSKELSGGTIAVICVFSIILAIAIVSTIYDVYLYCTNTKPISSLLIAFSFYTNGSKLISISDNKEQLSCINGIRVISMAWIILGHGYNAFIGGGVTNYGEVMDWFQRGYSMYLLGSTVSVDTFFVISGLLMAYGFMNAMYKGIHFNIFQYYIHRYIRLTPTLLALMLLNMTLMDYFGDGPIWPKHIPLYTICQDYWWTNMLYIQNYVNEQHGVVSCLSHTWYLAIDMQLYLLSPLILIPLWKWRKYSKHFMGILIVISIIIPFAVAWSLEITSNPFAPVDKLVEYQARIYIATESRAAPWLIGISLGYILHRIKKAKKTFSMNRVVALILTGGSLAVLATCVFAGQDMNFKEYNKAESSFHIALVRPAWSLALCWIIFACVMGYIAPINAILSLSPFQVLTRLSYNMYLLHVNIQFLIVYTRRVPIPFSDFIAMFYFWGFYAFTAALAVVWTLLFESPMITIEKLLFAKSTAKVKSSDINGKLEGEVA